MADDAKRRRLRALSNLPTFAQLDHRLRGTEPIDSLNRHERRKLQKKTDKMLKRYYAAWAKLRESGAGYPADQLLRQLASEYNNRYLSSGVHTQPISFRYIEPFLAISLFDGAAPYAATRPEKDHLFDLQDLLDFATSSDVPTHSLSDLLGQIGEGIVHHYSCIGDVQEFTILSSSGRQFAVSGFSLVRHGTLVHWFVLGGEIFDGDEWSEMSAEIAAFEIEAVNAAKKPLIAQLHKEKSGRPNPPIPLEGTERSLRTVLMGEINLVSEKHLARCYMSEREHAFNVTSDDPDTLAMDAPEEQQLELLSANVVRIERAGVLWNLAECLLKLPAYFKFKFSVVREAPAEETAKLTSSHVRNRSDQPAYSKYRVVSAIEVQTVRRDVIRRYSPPRYAVEIDGHWRQLRTDATGVGPNGEAVEGKTWIRAHNRWRERPARPREILLKSSVAAARLRALGSSAAIVLDLDTQAPNEGTNDNANASAQLYVMRCPIGSVRPSC